MLLPIIFRLLQPPNPASAHLVEDITTTKEAAPTKAVIHHLDHHQVVTVVKHLNRTNTIKATIRDLHLVLLRATVAHHQAMVVVVPKDRDNRAMCMVLLLQDHLLLVRGTMRLLRDMAAVPAMVVLLKGMGNKEDHHKEVLSKDSTSLTSNSSSSKARLLKGHHHGTPTLDKIGTDWGSTSRCTN